MQSKSKTPLSVREAGSEDVRLSFRKAVHGLQGEAIGGGLLVKVELAKYGSMI
jgi:hypothetical protein